MAACRVSTEFASTTIERRRVGRVVDAKFDRGERSSHAGWIDFQFDRNVKVPGTQLEFARGDRMQVFYSHRFTEGEMTALLNSTGFDDVQIKKSESFPYAVIGARVAGDTRAA
jgi:uncharacterized SAM-dependent methyltransferase